jgi:hypothetical protein
MDPKTTNTRQPNRGNKSVTYANEDDLSLNGSLHSLNYGRAASKSPVRPNPRTPAPNTINPDTVKQLQTELKNAYTQFQKLRTDFQSMTERLNLHEARLNAVEAALNITPPVQPVSPVQGSSPSQGSPMETSPTRPNTIMQPRTVASTQHPSQAQVTRDELQSYGGRLEDLQKALESIGSTLNSLVPSPHNPTPHQASRPQQG